MSVAGVGLAEVVFRAVRLASLLCCVLALGGCLEQVTKIKGFWIDARRAWRHRQAVSNSKIMPSSSPGELRAEMRLFEERGRKWLPGLDECRRERAISTA